MSSAFNLLTAGGARFSKSKFGHDIDLFTKNGGPSSHPHSKKRSKSQASDESESDSDEEEHRPAPPQQKVTLTGVEPLPKSLHTNLPSLITHETSPTTSKAGAPLLNSLRKAGIRSLWGVQCAVGGSLLEGRDTMCIAPTGSGKTMAYVLPTLVRLQHPSRLLKGKEEGAGIRSIILVPTYDLAVQIETVVKAVTSERPWRCLVLTKATEVSICESSPGPNGARGTDSDGEDEEHEEESEAEGNASKGPTLGLDILIATPERLHHLLQEGRISLSKTRHIILDEADRLLSPDFLPQVEPILAACVCPEVQKCFLSATIPSGSEAIARKWLRDGGVRVVVGVKDSAVTTVAQSLLYTGNESGKLLALRTMITEGRLPYPSLVFVQSVERADELYRALVLEGVRVDVVHGSRPKAKREEAIDSFRAGKVWMLVVTEVLARGMDFQGVKVVVNYDFPQTVQSYIHRIGRTGRAGRPGTAVTFFSNEDAPHLRTVANIMRASGCEVPGYMLELSKPSKQMKKNLSKAPIKRKSVGGGGRDVAKERARKRRDMVNGTLRRKVVEAKVTLEEV
ncbi:P-loop containing nucleoside triphosphate hydrolase protein [Naematelia encephala]|uniref:RNA helicase n=1 Tax=Naematelia encephala TaxID=71784 RepID=A0A1Y2AU26_9TREE|nr:P-loop containing nucleoside triphosphate hydrolase protein [Naematelia encephala]